MGARAGIAASGPRCDILRIRKVQKRVADRLTGAGRQSKRRLVELFPDAEMIEAYGQTESTDGVLMSRGRVVLEREGTVGRMNPHVHVAIRRADGAMAADDLASFQQRVHGATLPGHQYLAEYDPAYFAAFRTFVGDFVYGRPDGAIPEKWRELIVLGVLATAVIVPAAWYLIRLFLGVMHGPRLTEGPVAMLIRKGQFKDIQLGEFVVILPLLVLIFYIGFQPNPLTSVMEPSVVNTLQHTFQNVGSAFMR